MLGAAEAGTRRASTGGGRRALVAGACGATGEALLNELVAGVDYALVTALTRLPLPSTTRRLAGHHLRAPGLGAGAQLPAADDAFLVIGEPQGYYRRDEVFHALPFAALVEVARATRAAGARRLAVVVPVAMYSHSSAFRASLMNRTEYDLFALDFETLVLVRPAAPERFARPGHPGRRLAAFLLRQMHGLMPESYHPPPARQVAQVAARSLVSAGRGLTVVDADAVRAGSRSQRHGAPD